MDRNQTAQFLETEAFNAPFFQKMAAEGFEPQSPEEAELFLKTGFELLAKHKQDAVKAASSRFDFHKTAAAEIGVKVGPAPAAQTSAELDYVKGAAEYLAALPEIQQAVTVLQAA